MTDRYLVIWYDGSAQRATIYEDVAGVGPGSIENFMETNGDALVNAIVELPPAGNVGPQWRPTVWINGDEAAVTSSKT